MQFQNRSPTDGGGEPSLNTTALMKGLILTYRQGMKQGLPSINPWLLQHEGRAQVPNLWLEETSSIDTLTKAVCSQNKKIVNYYMPLFRCVYLGIPMFLLQWSITTFMPHVRKGNTVIPFSLPTCDSSCRLSTTTSSPEETPQLRLLSTHSCQGAAAHTAGGLTLFGEMWYQWGGEQTDQKSKGRNQEAAFGQWHVGFNCTCLATRGQHWLQAITCFFL